MKGNKISRPILIILILCVADLGKVAGALEGGRNRHETLDQDGEHKISKRYTLGRVPLSYVQRQYGNEGYSIDKRYSAAAASNFRDLIRQTRRFSDDDDDDGLSPSQSQSYRSMTQYYRPGNGNDVDGDALPDSSYTSPQLKGATEEMPLTDRELKTLLLLLDGYQETAPINPAGRGGDTGRNANFYNVPAHYFIVDEMLKSLGKQETGKKTSKARQAQLAQEQPMSFENSLGDNYPVFLTQKRSKRIGSSAIKKRSSGMASVRIKKETDPKVEASLDKIFASSNIEHENDEGHQHQHSTLIPTTAISSSSGQIPAPASNKAKKAINWSKHFGIDKRQEHRSIESPHSSSDFASRGEADDLSETRNAASISDDDINHTNDDKMKNSDDEIKDATVSPTSGVKGKSIQSASKLISGEQQKQKGGKLEKAKKDKGKQENNTEEKDDGRQWILKEFYKNLAMSTNVKRKRESSYNGMNNDGEMGKLEKLEQKMEEAGDQIIWDALKYTGAHRDRELSPEELAHVKAEIIQKLAAAYSLEKTREAIDEFRKLKDTRRHF